MKICFVSRIQYLCMIAARYDENSFSQLVWTCLFLLFWKARRLRD